MVKQSGLDAAFALALWLAWTRRWRALAVLVGAAALPVVAGVLSASSPHAWWDAVVAYRGQGDSLLTGSLGGRLHQFGETAPQRSRSRSARSRCSPSSASRARRSSFRLWLVGALVGVLGGGNFHAHYYVQLAAPLAVLGAYGAARLGRLGPTAVAAVVLVALASGAVLSLAPRSTQTRLVWPHDPHLRFDAEAATLIRATVPPGKPIAVTWGDASLYFLADRPPAVRSLWYRNAQAIPGAAGGTSRRCGAACRSSWHALPHRRDVPRRRAGDRLRVAVPERAHRGGRFARK